MSEDSDHEDRAGDCPPLPADIDAKLKGTCYSARNCDGKVLSRHATPRSCENNEGKSWRHPDGCCYNL